MKGEPFTKSVELTGGGAQTQVISTTESDDTVPLYVSKRLVVAVIMEDESGALNRIALQERTTAPATEDQVVFPISGNAGEIIGEESERVLFEVNTGNKLRLSVDGNCKVTLVIQDVL